MGGDSRNAHIHSVCSEDDGPWTMSSHSSSVEYNVVS